MRSKTRPSLILLVALIIPAHFSAAPALAESKDTPAAPAEIRAAVAKSVKLLQFSANEYTAHRECFSCHHQAMPMIAIKTAQRHGLKVDEKLLDKQRDHTLQFFRDRKKRFEDGKGTGGQVDTAGYALWTLEEAGHPKDDLTAAMTHYLLVKNKKLKYWRTTSNRPPSEVSSFTTTYLAARALKYYGTKEQQADITKRLKATREWISTSRPKETEGHVFRLQTLQYLPPDEKDKQLIQKWSKELTALQRKDGGWAQKPDMKSDPYATASVLVALRLSGKVETTSDTYQRGLKFLLKTQKKDGSWHVVSRSKPFQTYFESGFPYKKDQFISAAASSWATTALALALPQPKED